MQYTSFQFLLFVAITALIYFLFPVKKYQWTILLIASYYFYLCAGYKFAVFLVATTVLTYLTALSLDKIAILGKRTLEVHKTDWDRTQKKEFKTTIKKKKQMVAAIAVVINLGILAFLKYYNFFAENLDGLFLRFGADLTMPALKLMLPLGISFYTFQSVGYVIDVYHEKISAERNLAKFALFVSFFPQIIQGPISFYDQLAHQLYEPHTVNFTRMKHGAELILWGFFKKLVIADRAVIAINTVLDDYTVYGGTTLLFTILLYALQLYADFSGGIDISRGVAQILGIDLAQNFKRPYFATTINDYWRRWHITLGAWMKEYVFYPLALSKRFSGFSKNFRKTAFGRSKMGIHIARVLPTSFASLVVFLLVGIWHGASWKYVAFGLWNGGVIMLSTLLEPVFEQITGKLHIPVKSLGFRVFQMFRTFLIVLIGYVFDVAPSFSHAVRTIVHLVTDQNLRMGYADLFTLGLNNLDYVLLLCCTAVLFAVSLIQERNEGKSVRVMLDEKPFFLRYGLWIVGILTLIFFGIYGPGYDPAEFVYMQF